MVMPSFSTLWLLNAPPRLMPRRSSTNGRHAAQDVPRALAHRVLDADHLGAERGEELGGAGAGELPGEVADADVRERSRP